ncbi:MAG: N-6 DNA methylase [bacterium]
MITKEQAKQKIQKLIDKYNIEKEELNTYNEEATKTGFIQPFLKDVLGWDVNDRNEVSPEVKISKGRVDYGLKIDGKIRIFVEAKSLSSNLNKHIEQAVGYGYNRKDVPFVLLTDFEGIKLFDVTIKPDSKNPLKGLKMDLHWDQYIDQFDKLWLISKESAIYGKLDKLLLIKPKDRLPVDKAILKDLSEWREILAKDIFKNNPKLFHSEDTEKDADYLREITQKILDRLIFMRFCEDRGFIDRSFLNALFEGRTDSVGTITMVFLKEEFKHYNGIFDSDLFRPQEWENNLAIDFKIMRKIVLDTYNPYQFDVIPLEVLGNIYEQYLGYTIRLTEHQVKYELKPDVRKAGGVYYTPEYIVDYIVKNTVGKSLQELSNKKIKKLRILDPACGSGSFLIRAYEEMLNYYQNQKPKKQKKISTKQSELNLGHEKKEQRLTIHEKADILCTHIFGVDIDEQAVEVTKLSLMLKMLEGEQDRIHGKDLLPMLNKNIKCGNSLISGNVLELTRYFGNDYYKVKPFNWNEEFKEIIVDEKGFDVVIGNPPYSLIGSDRRKEQLYFRDGNFVMESYKTNTYMLFLEKGLTLLKKKSAVLGYIIPKSLVFNTFFNDARKFLLSNFAIPEIIEIKEKVFVDAEVGDSILFFAKKDKDSVKNLLNYYKVKNIFPVFDIIEHHKNIQSNLLQQSEIRFFEDTIKIRAKTQRLGDICVVSNGLNPGNIRHILLSSSPETSNHKKMLLGRDIKRYFTHWSGTWVNYDSTLKEKIKMTDIKSKAGMTAQKKVDFALRNPKIYSPNKIVIRKTADCILASYEKEGFYFDSLSHGIQLKKEVNGSILYILGLLNSKFINYIHSNISQNKGKVFAKVLGKNLERLPIRTIDFSNPADKKLHDDIVALVDIMLDLNKKLQTAKGNDKDYIQKQITQTDNEIDTIVYKLYNITEGEKKIIETVELQK